MSSALVALAIAACTTSGADAIGPAENPPSPAPVTVAVAAPPVPAALIPLAAVSPSAVPPSAAASSIVERARLEVSRAVTYDPAWFPIAYPNGDPPPDVGVCTDVVIRSLRAAGIDLQPRIHEDIARRRRAYTTVTRADRNIDHRRVTPMLTYLRAHATSLPMSFDADELSTWEPGDIVVWAFRPCPSCNPDHVGIVSDRRGPRGVPLVLHNIGPRPSEDDHLDAWTVLGHFRVASGLSLRLHATLAGG